MSEAVLIKCPKCATQLKVSRPQGPSLVACPKCQQQIRIGNAAASVSAPKQPAGNPAASNPPASNPAASSQPPPPAANPFDNLPDSLAGSASPPAQFKANPAANPKHAAQPRQGQFSGGPKSKPAKKPSSSNRNTTLIVAGCVGMLVVLGGVTFVFRDKLPTESLTSIIPVLDSPEKILREYADIADSMSSTIESIQDADSRDAAIVKIKALTERCNDLSARAVAIGPLTTEKLKSLDSWFKTQIPERSNRVKKSAERVSQMQRIANDALRSALFDFTFAASDVGTTMQSAWSPIPEPTNESDRGVYELLLVRRQVWGAMASASSESDYARMVEVFDGAAKDIEAIVEEHGTGLDARLGTPYFSINVSLSMSLGASWMDLQDEYGSLPDPTAYDRYKKAVREAQQAEDDGFGNPEIPGGPNFARPGGIGPRGLQPGRARPRGMGPGQSRGGLGPGGRPQQLGQ